MLFGLNVKEMIIGGMSTISLGLGVTNTVMNIKTTKQVKTLRSEMDKYVLHPAQPQQAQVQQPQQTQAQQAVAEAASAVIQQGAEILNQVSERMKEAEIMEAEKISDGDGASLDTPPTPPPTSTTPPPTPPPATEDGAKKGKK